MPSVPSQTISRFCWTIPWIKKVTAMPQLKKLIDTCLKIHGHKKKGHHTLKMYSKYIAIKKADHYTFKNIYSHGPKKSQTIMYRTQWPNSHNPMQRYNLSKHNQTLPILYRDTISPSRNKISRSRTYIKSLRIQVTSLSIEQAWSTQPSLKYLPQAMVRPSQKFIVL